MQLARAVSEVRQVVGSSVDDAVISRALRNHAYSVSAAINEIVDLVSNDDVVEVVRAPIKSSFIKDSKIEVIELLDDDSPVRPTRASTFPSKVSVASTSKRLRCSPPVGIATSASSTASVNQSTWPKILGRRSVDAESTYRGRPPPEMVAGAAMVVKRSPCNSQKNCIIRLATTAGSEVARLPTALASFLAPCIDAGLIACRAKIEFLPERLDIFTRFGITVEFAVTSANAFQCFERRAQEAEEQADKKKVPQKNSSREAQDVSDDLWQVIQVAFGNLTVDGVFGGRLADGAFSLLDDDPTTVTTASCQEDEEDENEKKPSEEELFGSKDGTSSLQTEDIKADDVECGLSVDLRPHQKVAVNWMKKREDGLLTSSTTANTQHHPLWTPTKFEDGTTFYLNRFTRMATVKPPPDVSKLCKGGILADEMGLGKTIVVLGRVTQDLNEMLAAGQATPGKSVSPPLTDTERSEHGGANGEWKRRDMDSSSSSDERDEVTESSAGKKKRTRGNSPELEQEDAFEEEDDGPIQTKSSGDVEYGTLVIVVTSLLSQWEEEIDNKVSPTQRGRCGKKFSRYTYYGADRDSSVKMVNADIVLTTFGVVAAEHKSKNLTLFKPTWRRIVLDEAQSVRNADTLQAKAVLDLKAERRWCLTGTPVQNGIDDLFQLFRFIRLEPWGQRIWWDRVIERPYKMGHPAALQRIRSVLADGPVLLRRTHKTVEAMFPNEVNGSSSAALPKLTTEIVRIDLAQAERAFYDSLYSRSKLEFEGMVASGKAMTSYVTILSLLIRLRQAADHPFLVLGRPKADKDEEQKRDDEYIKRISAKYFSATTDGASTSMTSSSSAEFARKALKDLARGQDDCTICLSAMTDPVMIKCAHSFCRECILPLANQGNYYGGGQCPVCREAFNKHDLVDIRLPSRENQISLADGSVVNDASQLLGERYRSSSKLDRLVMEIEKRRKAGNKDKFLVFSQFTQMLDLVQVALNKMDPPVQCQRLDGSLSASKRDQALKQFRDDENCEVMVMSLKAGCLGLNITCANVVILLDPWWNAAVEHQAIGRAHRMGQKRDVTVLRFIASETVEVKMLTVQERKKLVASDTLGFEQFGTAGEDDDTKASAKLTLDDLKEFFA